MKSLKILSLFLLVLVLMVLFTEPALAQCPMCKASAEASLKNGETHAAGLNAGILYLLAMPYILFCTIGGLWYWQYRKNKAGMAG